MRQFADSIPAAAYQELPDCGHMPFFEAPEPFAGIVQNFLSEHRVMR